MLTREQILQAEDLPRERVDVPEWGGAVWVRSMTGRERDAFEESFRHERWKNVRARLCALTLVDEHGERLFADADVEALGAKSAAALDRIFAAAQRLNALAPKDVEELEGN